MKKKLCKIPPEIERQFNKEIFFYVCSFLIPVSAIYMVSYYKLFKNVIILYAEILLILLIIIFSYKVGKDVNRFLWNYKKFNSTEEFFTYYKKRRIPTIILFIIMLCLIIYNSVYFLSALI